jgi:hypothetical protein
VGHVSGEPHRWVVEAASGASLPLHSADPEDGQLVARYVSDAIVAVLWIYPRVREDSDFDQDIAVYDRLPDGSLAHAGGGGSDWFGAPGTLPPALLWLSGFSFNDFVTGAVRDATYLSLLRHADSGAALAPEDAPTGAFIARVPGLIL